MTRWICTVCGYIHEGDQPPDVCPVCGVGPDKFERLPDEAGAIGAAAKIAGASANEAPASQKRGASAADAAASPKNLVEVRDRAREKLRGICAVYPRCDGDRNNICQREAYGKPIGLGGAGLGYGFAANAEALAEVRLRTRVVGPHFQVDTSLSFLGRDLSMPVMGASTSGLGRYGDAISEEDFCHACVDGCLQAGTISWRGDTFFYTVDENPGLDAIERAGGAGIPIFKPREQDALKRLIERAAGMRVPAVGVDLDGCGSTNFARAGQPVYRKSTKDIEQLVASTDLPFIVKGIMDADDAEACVSAGAKVVAVSNHGGRVLDSTPGVAEVLPEIAERVGDRCILVADGGVRTGYDVLKFLALGATAVLIGRDVIRAAIGGGGLGVKLQMDRLGAILKKAMLMTGCPDLASIDRTILR